VSGEARRELFAMTLDGPGERAVQLTDDARLQPARDCHWATDYERGLADGRISWVVRNFDRPGMPPPVIYGDRPASGMPPPVLYSAQVAFDAAGHITGLVPSSTEPLVTDTPIYSDLGIVTHDWSPDGTQVVYAAGPPQAPELHILDLRTRQTRQLTQGCVPVWSPDGSRIAFRRDHEAIFIIQPDGSGLQTLAQRPAHPGVSHTSAPCPGYYELVWSPDSSALLYGYLHGTLLRKDRDLYRIGRTGGEPQNLTRSILQSAVPIAWLKGEN
jgi:hypothetical protein